MQKIYRLVAAGLGDALAEATKQDAAETARRIAQGNRIESKQFAHMTHIVVGCVARVLRESDETFNPAAFRKLVEDRAASWTEAKR